MWMVFRPSSLDDEPLVWDGRDFALFSTLTNPVNPVLAFPVNLRPRTILQLMKISRFQLCCQLKKNDSRKKKYFLLFLHFLCFYKLKRWTKNYFSYWNLSGFYQLKALINISCRKMFSNVITKSVVVDEHQISGFGFGEFCLLRQAWKEMQIN